MNDNISSAIKIVGDKIYYPLTCMVAKCNILKKIYYKNMTNVQQYIYIMSEYHRHFTNNTVPQTIHSGTHELHTEICNYIKESDPYAVTYWLKLLFIEQPFPSGINA